MSTIVVSPSNVVTFPEGGGHFWVYMQYIKGFQSIGCEVFWLERFTSSGDPNRDAMAIEIFTQRMERIGLRGKVILYTHDGAGSDVEQSVKFIGVTKATAESVFRRADLLLNFHYSIAPSLLARFRKTALVDIDPGLLQFWISNGQLAVSRHDHYLTTGETVGSPSARFPDCGLTWLHIRPPVSLESWPFHYDPACKCFTTISSWWGGGGKGEFITDGKGIIYENNKRVTFLEYVDLPLRTSQSLELALNLGEGDPGAEAKPSGKKHCAISHIPEVTDYVSDAIDREMLVGNGWIIREACMVSKGPEDYQSYIRDSRGEFSCVKPSCIRFQNAWISDRTICYLSTGKPAVVQDTGPSAFLPNGEGMFRFSTIDEAVQALSTLNSDYKKHCVAARGIAEAYFDSKEIAKLILHECGI